MNAETSVPHAQGTETIGDSPATPEPDLSKAPDPVTITLFSPIVIKEQAVTELTFTEPTIDVMAAVEENDGGDVAKLCIMLAGMCGATPSEFGKMKSTDFRRCNEACQVLAATVG